MSDLFGGDAYFADAESFWEHQNEAVTQLVTCYEAAGWEQVIVMERGAYFASWDHRKTAKQEGGKVFITVSHQGEVSEHEGYVTNAEAKRRERAERSEPSSETPELTKPAQNYVDLHRHAAVRADLLGHSSIALRLIAAHMICGSDLWQVVGEPQKAAKPEIVESLEANAGQQAMQAEREVVQTMLALDPSTYVYRPSITQVFDVLQNLQVADLTRILTFLMAETLSAQSPLIDTLGGLMGTDMRQHWQPDQTFFELIRSKQILNIMIAEYAGTTVAEANAQATAKIQRGILNACATGERTPADPNWTPRFMTFPKGSYQEAAERSEDQMPNEEIPAIAAE